MRPRWNVFAQRIHLPGQTLGVFKSAIIKKKLIIYVSGNLSGLKANPTTFTDQINEIGFDTSNKFTESYAKMFSKKRPLECV